MAQWMAEFEFDKAQQGAALKTSAFFWNRNKDEGSARAPEIRGRGTFANTQTDASPPDFDDEFEFITRDMRYESSDDDEIDIIQRYQKTKDPNLLEPLFAKHQGTLNKFIRARASQRLPLPMVKGRVYTTFVDAVEDYSPERGAGLSTFFHSKMRNSNRYMKRYAQFAKASDNDRRWMEAVKVEIDKADQENRHLTDDELSQALEENQKLSISADQVRKTRSAMRNEFQGSRDVMAESKTDIDSLHRRAINAARQQFNHRDQKIIDMLFGLQGKTATQKNSTIASSVGVSPSFVSRRKKDIQNQIQIEMERLIREERPFE